MQGTPSSGTVVVIEDDAVFNRLIVRHLERLGLTAVGATKWLEAEAVLRQHEPDLIIMDQQLPDISGLTLLPKLTARYPVIMLTAFATVEQAVEAIKLGVAEYLTKPINLEELEVMVRRTLDHALLRRDVDYYKNRNKRHSPRFMVGHSVKFNEVMGIINAVAPTETTVLIQGESGVGKELVAQELHDGSARSNGNFVPLDCCTLQENLFESELFGHERGAFTGADRQKLGLIEAANGGTLFLDEIGEIGPSIQAKLLRVIETGRFRRLGGTKDLSANVRIVAATNRDLAEMVAEGQFREDLFYRLNAFVIQVPPLRDRVEDIADLVQLFLSHHNFSRPVNKAMTPESLERLTTYSWPGNVRELRNVVERSIILSGDEAEIRPSHLGLPTTTTGPAGHHNGLTHNGARPTLEELKRDYVKQVLTEQNGHRQAAAQVLGISERNLYRLIKELE